MTRLWLRCIWGRTRGASEGSRVPGGSGADPFLGTSDSIGQVVPE